MSKTTNPAVRLFQGTASDTRPTIDTPNGPIFSGTTEAKQWHALKAIADPLTALASSFGAMSYDKAQALAQIAELLPKLPDGMGTTAATLFDLSEAMQGRLSDRTQTHFQDVAGAYAYHVASLRDHAARARDALTSIVTTAPKPLRPDAPEPTQGQRLGTGLYKQLNG
jgi:hypothetical protein